VSYHEVSVFQGDMHDVTPSLTSLDLPFSYFYSPNSCGQVQVADIGIMGGPARKLDEATGKMMAVPGCKIFVGGRIGEDAHISLDPYKEGIPLEEDSLIPDLVGILKTQFGAVDKKKRKRDVLRSLIGIK